MALNSRKGFVETLEVILASLLFFIFLINILPAFIDGDGAAITQNQVINTLQALEADDQLRGDIGDRDLSGLNATISPYFPQQEVAVGLLWANLTQGTADRDIQLPSSMERVVVRVWNRDTSPSLSVNGTTVFDGSTPRGHSSAVITDQLSGGATVPVTVSGDLQYSVEVYSYQLNRALPTEQDVQGYGYVYGGANSTMQPAELRVFLW